MPNPSVNARGPVEYSPRLWQSQLRTVAARPANVATRFVDNSDQCSMRDCVQSSMAEGKLLAWHKQVYYRVFSPLGRLNAQPSLSCFFRPGDCTGCLLSPAAFSSGSFTPRRFQNRLFHGRSIGCAAPCVVTATNGPRLDVHPHSPTLNASAMRSLSNG